MSKAVLEETKKSHRLQSILAAAQKVFSQKGYHGATIRDIAREAQVAEGTIYIYFKSKKDLLIALFKPLIVETLTELIQQLEGQEDEVVLRTIMADRLKRALHNFSTYKLFFFECQFHEDLKEQFFREVFLKLVSVFEDYLKRRVEEGAFRPMNTHIAARAFFGMYISFVFAQEVYQDESVKEFLLEEIVDELAEIFLRGVKKS
jgi:AcrR family transcriptional regulator